jgi:hypothetical protein
MSDNTPVCQHGSAEWCRFCDIEARLTTENARLRKELDDAIVDYHKLFHLAEKRTRQLDAADAEINKLNLMLRATVQKHQEQIRLLLARIDIEGTEP